MKRHTFFKLILISLFCIFGVVLVFVYSSFDTPIRDISQVRKFIEAHPFPKTISEKKLTTVIMTGDVMLGRTVEISAREHKDFRHPFLKVAETLREADISFINLENPITVNCPPHTGGFTFCANAEMLEGLTYSGIDIVTLANNHTGNYGMAGLDQTTKFLNQKGIAYVGAGNLVVKEINNITFGFLGFDKAQQSNPELTQFEENLIKESDKKVNILIVAMHWGVEYKDKALPGVRVLAKTLVSDGADVVVGSHPHWVQDNEKIKGVDGVDRPVYYSLGNFVFDQMWSEPTKKGLVVRLTFDGEELVKDESLPVYMKERGQPEFVSK